MKEVNEGEGCVCPFVGMFHFWKYWRDFD